MADTPEKNGRRQFIKAGAVGLTALAACAPVRSEQPKAAPKPLAPPRRIVTGHDAQGRSRFIMDGPPPRIHQRTPYSVAVSELWLTDATPADNGGSAETAGVPLRLYPPKDGSVFRIIDFPPEQLHREGLSRERAMGDDGSGVAKAMAKSSGRDAGFHRTDTIDYAIVISGEIYALMDEGERLMRAGDVLVQRGTNHAWVNRSDSVARLAFVLIDAKPAT